MILAIESVPSQNESCSCLSFAAWFLRILPVVELGWRATTESLIRGLTELGCRKEAVNSSTGTDEVIDIWLYNDIVFLIE